MSGICRVSTTGTLVMLLPILEPRVRGCLRQPARFWTRFLTPRKKKPHDDFRTRSWGNPAPKTTPTRVGPNTIVHLHHPSLTYRSVAWKDRKVTWVWHTAAIPPSPVNLSAASSRLRDGGARSLSTAARQNLARHTQNRYRGGS
jgi:hypothetical protein